MPPVMLSSPRNVTLCVESNSFSGTFHAVSFSFTSSSSLSAPFSTRRMAPMAATNFDIDAA
jgi:hypothetical protein